MQTKIKVCVTFLDTAIHTPQSDLRIMLETVLFISDKFLFQFFQIDNFTRQANIFKRTKWNIQLIFIKETLHKLSKKCMLVCTALSWNAFYFSKGFLCNINFFFSFFTSEVHSEYGVVICSLQNDSKKY